MRILWRVIAVLVIVAAIAGIGFYAYNAGIANGLAQKIAAQGGQTQPAVPYPYYGYPFFGWGFGFLGCLIPLFLFFLILGATRALFWHGPMGWRRHYWHHHGPWGWREGQEGEDKGVPPFFEEWHKRAHGETPSEPEKQ